MILKSPNRYGPPNYGRYNLMILECGQTFLAPAGHARAIRRQAELIRNITGRAFFVYKKTMECCEVIRIEDYGCGPGDLYRHLYRPEVRARMVSVAPGEPKYIRTGKPPGVAPKYDLLKLEIGGRFELPFKDSASLRKQIIRVRARTGRNFCVRLQRPGMSVCTRLGDIMSTE